MNQPFSLKNVHLSLDRMSERASLLILSHHEKWGADFVSIERRQGKPLDAGPLFRRRRGKWLSSVNNVRTKDGGTHETGSAITKVMNDYARKTGFAERKG